MIALIVGLIVGILIGIVAEDTFNVYDGKNRGCDTCNTDYEIVREDFIKESKDIIQHLHDNNGVKYNLHKASEELQELALVLNQFLLKPTKVDEQEIIDEIGDVIIRIEILLLIYPNELIKERINYKLSKFRSYIDHKKYSQI